jgi:predicted NBD/HSP70 family sugar kinase
MRSDYSVVPPLSPARNADRSTVRAHNLSRVLRLVHETGSISRAAIARRTGLSATTVSALALVLLQSGLVDEAGEGKSRGGRPPIMLQFQYTSRHVLGIDIGASHVNSILMDLKGRIVARETARLDSIEQPYRTVDLVHHHVRSLMSIRSASAVEILGIGVGVPAPLDGERLDRVSDVIMPAWKDLDFIGDMRKRLGVPVYVDNDANLGAIAEKWWGSGRGVADLAYIKLGTGVGSGLIINNEIYRGFSGTAGEIGHTTMNPDGPACRCGNRGCLEGYVGIPAILAEIGWRRQAAGLGRSPIHIEDVVTAADDDPICREVIQAAGRQLGIAIANLLNIFNPELILLGGSLVGAGDILMDAVRAAAAERAMPKTALRSRIALSSLKEDVVAVGAATLAIHNAFQPSSLMWVLEPRIRGNIPSNAQQPVAS